jgi:predicted nucleic acid-binding protein
MNITLVDTDVLIDAARETETAVNYLDRLERSSELAVSVITEMELLVGCRSKVELRKVEHFLARFQVIDLTEQMCEWAVRLLKRYRLSHGLLIPDAMIAATAISLDCSLITKNQRDFRFIRELQLLVYP